MAEVALDFVNYVAGNPLLQDLLVGVASNAAWEGLKKISGYLCDRFKANPESFKPESVEEMEKILESELVKVKERRTPVSQSSLRRYKEFLFPYRNLSLESLEDSLYDYVAERMFYGVSFQSMLTEIGFQNVEYLCTFPSGHLRFPHYFDIKARYKGTPFPDMLLVGLVMDNRVLNPVDTVLAIPAKVDNINENSSGFTFRDYDYFVLIGTGDLDPDLCNRLKDMLNAIQRERPDLPRFLYFPKHDLDDIMKLKRKERCVRLNGELMNVRVRRGF